MQSQPYSYRVDGHDHFAPPDEDAYWRVGAFDTLDAARRAAEAVIDASLRQGYERSVEDGSAATPETLLASWRAAGEGASVVTSDPNCDFTEAEYAERRAREICGRGG